MRKFTKGKWEVCVDGSIDVFDESGKLVSTYSDVIGRKSDEQLMADARLIAAAPEMYGLIVDALRMCKGREVYASLYEQALGLITRIDRTEEKA